MLAGFHLVSLVMGERERGEWWVQRWAARKGGVSEGVGELRDNFYVVKG